MFDLQWNEDGTVIHNGEKYNAIKELDKKLNELGIPHEMHEMFDGYQICVPAIHKPNIFDGDAIQPFGSYGAKQDKLEVYGFNLTNPDGFLTVNEALKYFVDWWEKKNGIR